MYLGGEFLLYTGDRGTTGMAAAARRRGLQRDIETLWGMTVAAQRERGVGNFVFFTRESAMRSGMPRMTEQISMSKRLCF